MNWLNTLITGLAVAVFIVLISFNAFLLNIIIGG